MLTVLLVILCIFAVIFAVLSFVLLSPLSVNIVYREELSVVAGLSFIKYRILPKDESKSKKRTKKKKKKKTNSDEKGTSDLSSKKSDVAQSVKSKENAKSKKDLSETLKLVFEIMKSLFEAMGKHARVRVDELYVVVSKPDAADTAVDFGICTGIVSNILAFTTNFGKSYIKSENVEVVPDFVSGKSSLKTNITLSVPVYALLFSIARGYLKGISRK